MNDEKNPTVASPRDRTGLAVLQDRTRSLHVKRVPWSIWARARQNALASGVPFREFVIALLARSAPLPAQEDPSHEDARREASATPG